MSHMKRANMGATVNVLVLLLSLLSAPLFADQTTHDVAHFGASFAIETFTYGIVKKSLKLSETESFAISVFTTFLIGFTYKYVEQMNQINNVNFDRPMFFNAVGIGSAVLTIKMFDF